MIGLKRGTVVLQEHNPEWLELGRTHCVRIKKALGPLANCVTHVGSTSVQGLIAKPIIDIAVGVQSLDEQIVKALESVGYLFRPGADSEKDMLFVEADGEWRSAHIHIVKYMSMEWRNYINFRDYLIAVPEIRQQYASLKEQLAEKYSTDRESYTAGKADFIRFTLRKAMVWSYLDKHIDAQVDRPVGYLHVKGDKQLLYPVNYGYIPGVFGGDDEELDVYYLGEDQPLRSFSGKVIAIVHRADDVEDKLVACPDDMELSAQEICEQIYFQEQYYDTTVQTYDGCWMHIKQGKHI